MSDGSPSGLARWDGAHWTPFAGGVNGRVLGMALTDDGDLAVVGDFTSANGLPAASFVRLSTSCRATAAVLPTACAGSSGPVTLTAATLPWIGSRFASTATGFAPGAFAVSLVGLTSPGVFLGWLSPTALPGCDQLASQEAILLHSPQGGAVDYSLPLPNDPAFAGVQLYHQFLQLEVGGQGQLAALSSSNGLRLTIGALLRYATRHGSAPPRFDRTRSRGARRRRPGARQEARQRQRAR
ncbi:MAG: hypothetical protein KDE27_23930 [Planctomycetes bacterium]|nr:hypothetical protein [Planctomycetota bacterium]